jgi:hypothetical protein
MGHQRRSFHDRVEKTVRFLIRTAGPELWALRSSLLVYKGIKKGGFLTPKLVNTSETVYLEHTTFSFTMVQISTLLTALAAASGATASLARARRALEERQSNSYPVNAVQNWSNDFASLNFKTGSNGLFSVDWNNGPGGNFVVGRGWQPARDMSVLLSRDHGWTFD